MYKKIFTIGFFSLTIILAFWQIQERFKIVPKRKITEIALYFLGIILMSIIIAYISDIKNMMKTISSIEEITSTKNIFNVRLSGSNNIIDIVTVHPTGIYIIKKVPYEGHITGTELMDFWEADKNNRTEKFKNPVIEMEENKKLLEYMFPEPIYPVIILKNNVNSQVRDNWEDKSMLLIKEYEQEKIFKNKKYCISHIRTGDILEIIKQIRT